MLLINQYSDITACLLLLLPQEFLRMAIGTGCDVNVAMLGEVPQPAYGLLAKDIWGVSFIDQGGS